jgi:hypothetical protein
MADNASTNEIPLEKENQSLRRRVDELERAISDIQSVSHDTSREWTLKWRKIAVFGLVLFAGLFSSYLVLRDRWLENRVNFASINQLWWDTESLKTLAYPQYFLLIFLSVLMTALVMFLWRGTPMLIFSNLNLGVIDAAGNVHDPKRSRLGRTLLIGALILVNLSAIWMVVQARIPGWELLLALILFIVGQILLDPPAVSLRERFDRDGRFWLDAVLLIIAVCSALYASFGEGKPNLIFFVLLLLAGINFLRHVKRTPSIFWISLAALVALSWNIDGWQYVVIGDEYSFYTEVLNILDHRTAWELVNNVFNGSFVYGTHPYFSSYIHDFFMKLFDNHNFGWRFSNPVLVAASLPFFYYFFKAFVPRRVAITTVILLGFSHYLLSFSKIGYNNLQALFAMGLVLASFTWALKSMKILAFSLTGLAMGLCFYLYPAALYVILLPLIGAAIFMPPTNREVLRRWGWMIVSMSLLVYPLIGQYKYWEAKVPGTFLYTDVSSSAGMLASNILRNLLYSSLSYLYIPEQTHYVSIGYLDLLSSVFVITGFVLLLRAVLQRNRSALFLALSFLAMLFIVGATHGRNFPTATRMFLLLPWFALFAALGLDWSVETARTLFDINSRTVGNLLVGSIVVMNLYQAYVVDVRNMAQYHDLAPMFIKTVREIKANPDIPPKSYAFVALPGWDTTGLQIVQKAYRVPESPTQLINLPMEGSLLPASAQELVSQRDVVVIVKGNLEPDLLRQVGAQLQGWGKSMCEIKNGKGTLQFQLWHSGDLGWLCR